jgi:hypothetical protein
VGDVAEGFGTGPLDRTDDRDDIGRMMVCIRLERGYGSLSGDLELFELDATLPSRFKAALVRAEIVACVFSASGHSWTRSRST